jgi:DNA-binding response OmpR family regulator
MKPLLLVIDDEIEICEILKGFFSERGYKVIYSVTGQGGLDAVSAIKPSKSR